jgi:hypothetical protein
MTKSVIWVSYDLGVQGDYASLYAWLDAHEAKECGDSLAFLNYEHELPVPEQLATDLDAAITVDKRTRIYVIYRDHHSSKDKGVFIFGARRESPWTGYAPNSLGTVDEGDPS